MEFSGQSAKEVIVEVMVALSFVKVGVSGHFKKEMLFVCTLTYKPIFKEIYEKVWQLYPMLSFLKKANEETCKVKVLPWQNFCQNLQKI